MEISVNQRSFFSTEKYQSCIIDASFQSRMLERILAISVCQVKVRSLGIWCVNCRSFPGTGGSGLSLIWHNLPLMPIRTLLWTWNICKSGTKSSKTNHMLCCNTILLWLQDLRLLEWPPGMESGGEDIRAGYVRKCGLPWSGSHSESHPKCRTFPGLCHHIVAGRVAAYKNFCSRKFSSFS